MQTEATIVERPAQPYLGITVRCRIEAISEHADRTFPELFGWIGAHGVELVGAPFIKYNVIDMEGELEMEFGVPVVPGTAGDARVVASVLLAGRYATLTHVGGYNGLIDAHAALQAWGKAQGLDWDIDGDPDRGGRWGARFEVYRVGLPHEPDKSRWETDVIYKIRG